MLPKKLIDIDQQRIHSDRQSYKLETRNFDNRLVHFMLIQMKK